jgi:glycosyltransferase involved in cell wall biosynthesis
MIRGREAKGHAGIYLGIRPEFGGMYQYCLAVVRGLALLADDGWRVTAFTDHAGWRPILPASFRLVEAPPSRFSTRLRDLYLRVDRTRGATRRSGRFLPVVRAIDASDCDLVVYPGQDKAGYQAGKPALVAVHDLMHRYLPHFAEYQGGERETRDRHFGSICAAAAGVLVDSEVGKGHVVESYGLDPRKLFVLPFAPPGYLEHAPDVDVVGKHGLPERYFFYPAQFWEHKNHIRLLEAVARLKAEGIPAKLVLCGAPKNNYARVLSRIAELGLDGDVRILGYVPNEEMASLYRRALATVFVSLIGPTNIPPLEAMSLGCPLIVSGIYAMPEQAGDAALLVDPLDPADIAAKMASVWRSESLAIDLSARGIARAAAWTEADFSRRLAGIVRELVEATRVRGGHP